MLDLLKYRVVFITLLFGAFGGALSLLLKIEELKNYYPSLAVLIALCVSLLISFLLKARWSTRLRDRLKIVAVLLFLLFVATAALHTYYIINRTFEYREFDEVNRYVKGNYTDTAIAYKKRFPFLKDEEILRDRLEGVTAIEIFWTKESINNNIFRLIASYCGLVLFFVASVTLLSEILATNYRKRTKKPEKSKKSWSEFLMKLISSLFNKVKKPKRRTATRRHKAKTG